MAVVPMKYSITAILDWHSLVWLTNIGIFRMYISYFKSERCLEAIISKIASMALY